MGATSLSVIARKAAGTCGDSGWQRGRLVGIPDESNRPNRTSLSVNVRKAAGREGRGTSLSVTARKAAERVVAQLDGDGDRSMSLSVNMWKAAGHECGGFILFSFKGRELGTSLSVNERKAAERVVAQLEW
ncbi:hypothetical protein N7505_005392 [Penicillium chrysogenum]|uniref:Uncharacterized protein n=1 Tax=Penicillium chrysogenum TaxID=5076 RepID=A0ABQ8WHZ0_PENCH|nr:hypothetical protein N7505_005392 [Penicillium chrysogenum]